MRCPKSHRLIKRRDTLHPANERPNIRAPRLQQKARVRHSTFGSALVNYRFRPVIMSRELACKQSPEVAAQSERIVYCAHGGGVAPPALIRVECEDIVFEKAAHTVTIGTLGAKVIYRSEPLCTFKTHPEGCSNFCVLSILSEL